MRLLLVSCTTPASIRAVARLLILSSISFALVACDSDPQSVDAGVDSSTPDAGPMDSGIPPEICMGEPSGTPPVIPDPGTPEAAPELDCGVPEIVAGTSLSRWPYLESATQTSVRIAWTTTSGGRGVVRYAADPAGTWTEAEAVAEMFPTARTGQAADYVAFDATLAALTPNSAYCYEIVEDGVVLARNLRFDTAWDGAARPVRMLVLGDSGSGSADQLAVRDAFMTNEYDIFLHMGDMAYGSGEFTEFEANFFEPYQDLMHRVPVFPTMGNHEYKTDAGQPYLDVYHLFEAALRAEENERYYSFDYANIHFTSLDSNDARLIPIYVSGDRSDDDMFDWLVDDIGGSDAEWKIVFMHHPFYSSSSRGIRGANVERFLSVLEDLGVDLILAGHDHHYERTVPLLDGCTAVEPAGITQIIAGGSGAGLRDVTLGQWFTAGIHNTDYTYLSLEVHGCRLRGQALDTMNTVVDEFELYGCDP